MAFDDLNNQVDDMEKLTHVVHGAVQRRADLQANLEALGAEEDGTKQFILKGATVAVYPEFFGGYGVEIVTERGSMCITPSDGDDAIRFAINEKTP